MSSASPIIFAIDAIHAGQEHGLNAIVLAARALEVSAFTVATSIVSASKAHVTDVTDIPVDTVAAQLQHLDRISAPGGILWGNLANRATAKLALESFRHVDVPSVLDLQLTGPGGATVLSDRGIEEVMGLLAVPRLVIIGRTDAELFTGGEITSLDDAQVAAQRIIKRGARGVLIKCGPLPARHFDVQEVERPDEVFNAELYFDGVDFALFEAPHIHGLDVPGASAAFAVATLSGLIGGQTQLESIRSGKQFVTEALRATRELGLGAPLQYFWRTTAQH